MGNKTLRIAIDAVQPDWYRVGDNPCPQGVISVLATTYTLTIRADPALRGAVARERAGFYAAEARLNNAMAEVREFFANKTPPGTAYTNSLASIPALINRRSSIRSCQSPVRTCTPVVDSGRTTVRWAIYNSLRVYDYICRKECYRRSGSKTWGAVCHQLSADLSVYGLLREHT